MAGSGTGADRGKNRLAGDPVPCPCIHHCERLQGARQSRGCLPVALDSVVGLQPSRDELQASDRHREPRNGVVIDVEVPVAPTYGLRRRLAASHQTCCAVCPSSFGKIREGTLSSVGAP